MSLSEIVVEATLKPDGTLELDQKPNLSPGRVQVTVKPLAPDSNGIRGLVEVMDEIKQSQRARGYPGRTLEHMQADLSVCPIRVLAAAYNGLCEPSNIPVT
jgi:hypothetical protein